MTTPPATVVFDDEAIEALANVNHRKHRRALSFIEVSQQAGVSVVDATVAQAAEAAARPVAILSSDSQDMRHLGTLIEGDTRVAHL